jgi:mannose-6-phosphate isomerase-like protein (cupin superfamily)
MNEYSRRAFLELVAVASGAASLDAEAVSVGRAMALDEGELCYVGRARDPVRIKVSKTADGSALSMIVQEVSPGGVIPDHLHENEDEIVLIQAGSGVAAIDGRETAVGAGSVVWVPKGTWHSGRNTGTGALRWTGIYAPAGFEGYFREISTPPGASSPRQRSDAEWEALDRRYGIRYRR